MAAFSTLLRHYIERAGISDAELARSIGVGRQTVFRWKEGLIERPRRREDVLACAAKLRLSPQERDALLLAAGFPPEVEAPHSGPSAASAGAEDVGLVAKADGQEQDEPAPAAVPSPGATPARARRRRSRLAAWALLLAGLGLLAAYAAMQRPAPLADALTPTPQRVELGAPPAATPAASALPTAAPGETLLLVAEFANYAPGQSYNVAGRIRETLQAEIAAAGIKDAAVRLWPEPIYDELRAAAVISATNAALLVWGEYDSGRVRANTTLRDDQATWERLLPSPDELSPTINADVPREVRALALLSLGRLYRAQGDLAGAATVLAQALEQPPSSPQAAASLRFYLATVLGGGAGAGAEAGAGAAANLERAISLYSEVIAAQPTWTNARYNRGVAYLGRYYSATADPADLERAIADFDAALARRADFADAYLNRGIAYYERRGEENIAAALADFDRAVELAPASPRAYYNRALARQRAGHDDWPADLEAALKLQPDYAAVFNAYCWGYALSAEPGGALPYCDRALEMGDPGSVHDGRGIALARAGRTADAAAAFESYLLWLRGLPPQAYEHFRGPQVEQWIKELQAGRDPFTEALLASLR